MDRRLILITGASAGIGAEFARQYAARGWDVALTARREDRLKDIADEVKEKHGASAIIISADLADPTAPENIVRTIAQSGRAIDGIVNNAGYGLPGTFFNTSWEEQSDFLRVLYLAPVELVHRILPSMKERNYGRIINVASLAGIAPASAGHTLYGSVKAAMIKFSEAIHAEAEHAGLNIHCSALCPGFTYSEFHDVNGTREATKSMPDWLWMEAQPVVEAGIAAVEKGKPIHVPGGVNKTLAALSRGLPDSISRKLSGRQAKKFRSTGDT